MVRLMNRMSNGFRSKEEAAAAEEILLLREIRDSLKNRAP
jgi:large-conductance mechanosensitive channel